mgnify:CR=1 FL=1
MFTVRTEQKHRTLFILWVIMNFTVATRNTIFTSQPVFLSTQERLLTAIALSPFLIQKLEKGDEELAESNDTLADGTYNEKRIEFFKKNNLLLQIQKIQTSLFLFFIHMPISNIVNGGHWATPQYERNINKYFKRISAGGCIYRTFSLLYER